ncbi:uncharacterized protein [Coffea arabica]|uniref:RNase H type-1 domain-containing protein n=1 Tax=Coffea arabica TaxID=13443 RepID=A0ABM4V3M9_COFAR
MCSRCSCCQQAQESVSHLFLHGAVARGVWEHFFKVFGHLPFNASGVAAMLSYWFSSHSKVSATHVRVLVPLLVLWFIWKSRNFARFKVGSVTQAQVIFQIQEFLCQMSGLRVLHWFLGKKPPPGWFKLNTDASVIHGRASGGGVVRDHCGRVIFAYYREFGELDVLEAEVQSLREGQAMCAARAVCTLIVESDSKVLVQLVNSEVVSKWTVCNILREIRHFLRQINAPLHHVFCEANSVADALASLRLGGQRCYASFAALPLRARGEARLDCYEIPRLREVPIRA